MVKAAALYLVLIISLLIAILSVSLLSVAFYYRLAHQKIARLERLRNNLEAGTTLVLATNQNSADTTLKIDLYQQEQDSLLTAQEHWGIYMLHTVHTYALKDTLKRAFLSAPVFTDSAAIYLADEDRPLSLSGTTKITGNGQLPQSGLRQAYVDGKGYSNQKLLYGKTTNSDRELLPLAEKWLSTLSRYFSYPTVELFKVKDSLINSFYNPVKVFKMRQGQLELSGLKLQGKLILVSDTSLTIHSDMVLEDVLIYAPVIHIENDFKGSCQLFARDSILIGKHCKFSYPSFAGVFKAANNKSQAKIQLAEDSQFSGILLSQEKKRSELQTLISLGKGSLIRGEVYAAGYVKMEAPVTIQGKVSAKRFLMQRASGLYENYLIDVVINRNALSKYYLSSSLFPSAISDQKILKWLY